MFWLVGCGICQAYAYKVVVYLPFCPSLFLMVPYSSPCSQLAAEHGPTSRPPRPVKLDLIGGILGSRLVYHTRIGGCSRRGWPGIEWGYAIGVA